MIKDNKVWEKFDKIWDIIKNKLGIKFHSEPVEYKYLKVKVREFDGVMVFTPQTSWVMICQKKYVFYLHHLHNY